MIASASPVRSGSRRKARSRMISIATPPRPKASVWPKSGSRLTPAKTSMPPAIICCTKTPASVGAPGIFASRSCSIRQAAATAASSRRSTSTSPYSDLCAMSSETALSTTGNPIARAASTASLDEATSVSFTTGMPCPASSPFASYSLIVRRAPPCQSHRNARPADARRTPRRRRLEITRELVDGTEPLARPADHGDAVPAQQIDLFAQHEAGAGIHDVVRLAARLRGIEKNLRVGERPFGAAHRLAVATVAAEHDDISARRLVEHLERMRKVGRVVAVAP